MRHIDDINIVQFRGVKNLQLLNTSQINLLVGRNNSGKTSVLEAIELYCHPQDISQFALTSRGRDRRFFLPSGLPLVEAILWLFPFNLNGSQEDREDIIITGLVNREQVTVKAICREKLIIEPETRQIKWLKTFENHSSEEVRGLEITLETNNSADKDGEVSSENFLLTDNSRLVKQKTQPLIKTKMVTPIDHRVQPTSSKSLTKTIMSGDKHQIIQLLKLFDENIEGIEVLSPDGRYPVTYFKHKKMGHTPVAMYGDGVRRVLTIAYAVLQCRDGVLLIDEIETAVHAKLFEKFFEWLVNACKSYNVQLFATTHSLETIDSILAADKESLENLVTYRLETKETGAEAKRFNGKDLYSLRYELGQDVR